MAAPPIHVLFVEDDPRLADFTGAYLRDHGVSVTAVGRVDAALAALTERSFDALVLDVMLPDGDGFGLCKAVRERSGVPVLMVTARGDEADRVRGLELGADDYVVKPFSPRELLARIQAAVRRDRGELGPSVRELHFGPLSLQPGARTATLGGRSLQLTSTEFDLLLAFAERPHRVLSREHLLERVKGSAEEAFERAVDVQLSRLRQKLSPELDGAQLIRTIRGVGYMFSPPAERAEPS